MLSVFVLEDNKELSQYFQLLYFFIRSFYISKSKCLLAYITVVMFTDNKCGLSFHRHLRQKGPTLVMKGWTVVQFVDINFHRLKRKSVLQPEHHFKGE